MIELETNLTTTTEQTKFLQSKKTFKDKNFY